MGAPENFNFRIEFETHDEDMPFDPLGDLAELYDTTEKTIPDTIFEGKTPDGKRPYLIQLNNLAQALALMYHAVEFGQIRDPQIMVHIWGRVEYYASPDFTRNSIVKEDQFTDIKQTIELALGRIKYNPKIHTRVPSL